MAELIFTILAVITVIFAVISAGWALVLTAKGYQFRHQNGIFPERPKPNATPDPKRPAPTGETADEPDRRLMANRYLHIGFRWADGNPKTALLQPIFEKGLDWIRYAPNCWIVWTSSDPDKWYSRLKPYIEDRDSLFIVEINVEERQGWLSESIWEWLDKERR